jgi:hypothetical protein
MSTLQALMRRELWEHRAIVLAPAAFGALFVIVNLLAALGVVKIHISTACMRSARTGASCSGNLCLCPTPRLWDQSC